MSPALRAGQRLRIVHRQVSSTTKASQSSRRVPPLRPQQTSRPPRPSPPKPDVHSEPAQVRRSLFDHVLPEDPRTRASLIRCILIIPIVGVVLLHLPYEVDKATGGSMSPFLNPNYDPDIHTSDFGSDHILVHKYSALSGMMDPNGGKKAKRRAEGSERPEDALPSREFQRGQVITFYVPHQPDRVGVKRIVGLPGDIVQPLSGYPGGDQPVLVPWNHLWVEGDAESREKSLDSNWYGPISQSLVIGEATAVWSSWFKLNWIDWKQHNWPAQQKGRVQAEAMLEAASNPEVVDSMRAWSDGRHENRLQALRESPEVFFQNFVRSQDVRKRVREFYRSAALIIAKDNPESDRWHLAQDIIKEMEKVYGRHVLREGMIKRSTKVDNATIQTTSTADQQVAVEAENRLKQQGWSLQRDKDGKVITHSSQA